MKKKKSATWADVKVSLEGMDRTGLLAQLPLLITSEPLGIWRARLT